MNEYYVLDVQYFNEVTKQGYIVSERHDTRESVDRRISQLKAVSNYESYRLHKMVKQFVESSENEAIENAE